MLARECQKPKRAKDAAYHMEKMLLCKQEEAGIQLNAEQADWRDNTDDELEDQKLEAHYMYMAQFQEVSPYAAYYGPIFDDEALQKNDDDNDLAKERELLASLIEKLICEINESKNRNKFLETSNKVLIKKLKGKIEDFKNKNKSLESSNYFFKKANNRLSETNNLLYADSKKSEAELARPNSKEYESQMELECAKVRGDLLSYNMDYQKSCTKYTDTINDLNQTISEMKDKLSAHQETISILSKQKEAQMKLYKTQEDKELEKVIELENKVKLLDNIVYKTGQTVQTMNMLNNKCRTSFAKPEFLKKAQRANPRLCLNEEMVANLRYFNPLELEVDILRSQLETQTTQFLNEIDRLSREYYYADHMNAILGVYTELDKATNLQCDYLELLEKYEGLETELSTSKMMSKSFESVQKHAINLELELQQCQDKIKNDKFFKVNQTNDFCKEREQYFEIRDLKAQLQDKGIVINELKKLIEKLKGKSVDTKFEKSLVIRQPNAFKSQRPSVLGKLTTFSNSIVRKDFSKSISVTQTNVSNDFSKPVTAQTLPTNKKSILKKMNVLTLGILNAKTLNGKFVYAMCDKCVLIDEHAMCVLNSVDKPIKKIVASKSNQKPRNFTRKLYEHVKIVLFIIDSGCSKHMTGNLKLLINFVEKFLGMVKFGNDQIAPILRYGDLVQGAVMIKRVYYVEGLNHNLFSVGQLCDVDLEVAFRFATSSQPWLWHRRLSHFNFDTINLLSKNDIVVGLPKLKFVKDHLCSSCELGKAKRKSFHTKLTPSSKRRLQLLHMDLCGPMRVANINGKRYVLVIVDDYSRYTWTHFLRSKDETPEVLINFLRLIQRGLQAQVRVVRTNKGTKFFNQTLHAYFATEGILHQTSIAQTPEQNGVVKRRNRTFVEAARTMLSAAKVPLFFWAEAIATACFTQNRSLVIPRHEKTPYHIINDQKPSVKFFHIFGSICYIVNDGENLNKMKEKGDECIFVGYSTQSRAYRVFNKRTRVIMESIHVNFDEWPYMASDHSSSDPAPKCQTMALKHDNLSPTIQRQENVPQVDRIVTTSNELDLLFSLMFDELLNGSSKVVSKSFAVSAADAPNQCQHHTTPLNIHTTPAPTCQIPTLEPTVTSFENINQAETYAKNDQVTNDEFINIFCTPLQNQGETSSRHVDLSNMHTFYQRYPSEHRWTKYHPLEQVIGNPLQSVRTRRQLESDAEMCMFTLTVCRTEPKNIKEAMANSAWIESMQQELHQFDRLDEGVDFEESFAPVARLEAVSIGTPMATKHLDADLSGTLVDQMKYHSKVGALMYLTANRLDIMHATCYCARYQAQPIEKHLTAVKRIFRYLKDTIQMGLWYPKDIAFELTAFLDLDHTGCLDSRKSTYGGIQFLGGDKLVSWSSKKPDCSLMSSAEAEYVFLSACCAQVLWMRTQLTDYGFHFDKIPMYCNSKAAIAISCNPV
nr:hypothetical protein [Tanacetum cinerariifolium]